MPNNSNDDDTLTLVVSDEETVVASPPAKKPNKRKSSDYATKRQKSPQKAEKPGDDVIRSSEQTRRRRQSVALRRCCAAVHREGGSQPTANEVSREKHAPRPAGRSTCPRGGPARGPPGPRPVPRLPGEPVLPGRDPGTLPATTGPGRTDHAALQEGRPAGAVLLPEVRPVALPRHRPHG